MRGRPTFVSATGIALAVVLLLAVAAWVLLDGLGLFSPGALNAEAGPRALGGVHSHAELGDRCGACHPAPWSGRSSADACLDCHTGVAAELKARKGLHGGLAGDRGQLACGPCHPEHDGPQGALTAVDESRFGDAHDATGFSLASHRETAQGGGFTCADCHPDGYRRFDQAVCSACHREIDAAFMDRHQATYGKDCLACHDGTGRVGADFDHGATGFPLEGKHADVPCADCHEDANVGGRPEGHTGGLLRVPRRRRRARRRLRPALRRVPLGRGVGRRHLRPRRLPPRPRRRGAQGHVRDLPPGRDGHVHVLRVPRAHHGQRARRARRAFARRAQGLRALPPRRPRGRGRLTITAAGTTPGCWRGRRTRPARPGRSAPGSRTGWRPCPTAGASG